MTYWVETGLATGGAPGLTPPLKNPIALNGSPENPVHPAGDVVPGDFIGGNEVVRVRPGCGVALPSPCAAPLQAGSANADNDKREAKAIRRRHLIMGRHSIPGVVTLALLLAVVPARAQAPSARITAVSPEPPGTLRANGALYARIEYESGQPLTFQARGRLGGRNVEGARMNPSPTYPAGKGEAIAWISFDDGVRIDEIRVVVSDARWNPLTEVSAPANVEWSVGAAEISRPAWVSELNDGQQRAVSQSMQDASSRGGGALMAILPLVFLLVPAYPVLQMVAWKRLQGRARTASALPLIVMIPVYAFSAFALLAGSNLWPIWIVFLSPPAAIFVGIVLFLRGSRTQAA